MKEKVFTGRIAKKLLSLALAVVMVAALMPVSALTASATEPEGETHSFSVTIIEGEHGSVDKTSVDSLTSGTSISASGNVLTVGTETVTATGDKSGDVKYAFDKWEGIPTDNSITDNVIITAYFKEASDNLDDATISEIPDQKYTGKEIEPNFTVSLNDGTLTKDTDYTVAYENNTAVGTATVTITGIGSYSGTNSKTFKIVEATPAPADPVAANFVFTAPDTTSWTEGTTVSASVVPASGVEGMGDVTVKYYSDAACTTEVTPNTAGTYYVAIDVAEGDKYTAKSKITDSSWTFTLAANYKVTFTALGPITINGESTTAPSTQYTATIKKTGKTQTGYTTYLPDSVVVKVGGTTIDSSKYSYSSSTGKIVLPKTIVTGDISILASAPFKISWSPTYTFTKGKATKNFVMTIGHGVSALKAANLTKLYISSDGGTTWKLLTEKTYYTKKTTGSISITFPKTAFLNKLASGTYRFKAKFDGSFSDQKLQTTMVVKAATTSTSTTATTTTTKTTTPTTTTASTATNTAATTKAETSDNMNVLPYIALMVVCACVMTGFAVARRKK